MCVCVCACACVRVRVKMRPGRGAAGEDRTQSVRWPASETHGVFRPLSLVAVCAPPCSPITNKICKHHFGREGRTRGIKGGGLAERKRGREWRGRGT